MLGKQPFDIVFTSGVVRFDSVGNLFVNLPHSDDDPMPVQAGDRSLPAPERRARVHGPASTGAASGSFPASADLPRGLTVEVKGYTSATYADGRLVVSLPGDTTIPDWFEAGAQHVFTRSGSPLKLWVKSSLPDGVTLADASLVDTGPPTQPKPVARAQFQPTTSAAEPAPAPQARPSAEGDAGGASGPYRPGRLPAGHYGADRDQAKSGLGCSTLAVAVSLAVLGLITLI